MGRSINTPMTERERITGEVIKARGSLAFCQAEVERLTKRLAEAEKELADYDLAQAEAMREAAGFIAGM